MPKWLIMFFTYSVDISLLVSCLIVLLVPGKGVLEFPTVVVALSISAFNSVSFSCIYFEDRLLGTYTLVSFLPDFIDPFRVKESSFFL